MTRRLCAALAFAACVPAGFADKGNTMSETSPPDGPTDQVAEKRIQQAVAKQRGVDDPSRVDVTIFDDVKVPGVVVFMARVGKSRRGAWSFGTFSQGRVELERERAIAVVIRAWGYGAKRTVPADDVAEVVGELLGTVEPAHPITTRAGIDAVPDAWRKQVALPREIVDGGRPGVEFWVRMGRPSLARARVTFAADGTPTIDLTPAGDDSEPR